MPCGGIGVVGAAITGIVLLGESANPMRPASLALIVLGIIGLETQHSQLPGCCTQINFLTDIKLLPGRDCQHLLFSTSSEMVGVRESIHRVVAVRAANQRMAVFPDRVQ